MLAVIDPEQLRAAVDQSAAQLTAADASIRLARATRAEAKAAAERAKKQVADGLPAQEDLEAAIATADRSEASLASAVANAAQARAHAGVGEEQARQGDHHLADRRDRPGAARWSPEQTVTAGFSTPVLFKIAEDLTHMRLDVDVDEADVGRAREGQEASFTVEAYPDRSFPSRVLLLLNEPKTTSNVVTYKARLSVDNGERLLRPGMTATATIVADTRRDVLLVPNAALRFVPPSKTGGAPGRAWPAEAGDGGRRQEGRVRGRGRKLRRVPVKLGATDGTSTEILGADLAPGAEVAIDTLGKE